MILDCAGPLSALATNFSLPDAKRVDRLVVDVFALEPPFGVLAEACFQPAVLATVLGAQTWNVPIKEGWQCPFDETFHDEADPLLAPPSAAPASLVQSLTTAIDPRSGVMILLRPSPFARESDWDGWRYTRCAGVPAHVTSRFRSAYETANRTWAAVSEQTSLGVAVADAAALFDDSPRNGHSICGRGEDWFVSEPPALLNLATTNGVGPEIGFEFNAQGHAAIASAILTAADEP